MSWLWAFRFPFLDRIVLGVGAEVAPKRTERAMGTFTNKTVLVTGANSGLGFEAVAQLAGTQPVQVLRRLAS